MAEANHGRRFGILWLVCTLIGLRSSTSDRPALVRQPGDGRRRPVRGAGCSPPTATPFVILVLLFLLFAVFNFRQPKGETLEGPAERDNSKVQVTWIVVTSIVVLAHRDLRLRRADQQVRRRLGHRGAGR